MRIHDRSRPQLIRGADQVGHIRPIRLLTDENMPEARGHELAAQLRRLELSVLYVTGYSDMLFTDRSTLWEGQAYIEKPVSARGLSQAISLLLGSRTRALAPIRRATSSRE
jgi:FixJ family two-component response regulator